MTATAEVVPPDAPMVGDIDLSIVVPVYNERECLAELRRRLFATLRELEPLRSEAIFVNDGSTDGSKEILDGIVGGEARAHVIHLTRNFGHHCAMTAGLDHARGKLAALMDADLQGRPEELPKLLRALTSNAGVDVAYGIRVNRQDSWFKRAMSAMFTKLMSLMAGSSIPMNSSTYRVMARRCVDALNRCRERSRALAALVAWLGFAHIGVAVTHGARYAGKTKYTTWKSLRWASTS